MIDKQNRHEPKALGSFVMMTFGLFVGIIGGFGAIGFRLLISLFHNLLFYGRFDLEYDANVHAAPSIWGAGIILVPVIAVIIVTWLIRRFAPEAKGHGVPEVIDAIYYNEGRIRPIVAGLKAIASALSIGSGASVGREGPIIQIGSAFGSTLGQWFPMPMRQRITLIAAGAGAGIAATFNAPIGGIAFAIELLLVSVNAGTISVVAIATITAAYIGRYFLGLYPAFDIPELAEPDGGTTKLIELILFLPFGVLIGLAATGFIQLLYKMEDFFEELPLNVYVRNSIGMLIVGTMMYVLMHFAGHYYVQGVGYATIVDILAGLLTNPSFLLLLFLAKLLATTITLSSGASGGVFSPALYLGATLGAAFGKLAAIFLPHSGLSPIMFAVAGMAGMVSGTTGAVLTAITMLFEMTRDYNAILPIMLTVAMAYFTRILLASESIYTLKLIRRGREVHEGLQAAVKTAQTARSIMATDFIVIDLAQSDSQINNIAKFHAEDKKVILIKQGNIVGLLKSGALDLNEASIETGFITVLPNRGLVSVLRRMHGSNVHVVMVVDEQDQIAGVISSDEITEYVSAQARLMNESI